MTHSTIRSLSASLLLHGCAAFAIALVTILPRRELSEVVSQVFTIVPSQDRAVFTQAPSAIVTVKVPQLTAPSPTSTPQVMTPPSEPTVPRQAALPPAASPARQRLHINEFRKLNSMPGPSSTTATMARPIPRIAETYRFDAGTPAVSPADGDKEPGFATALLNDLQKAFVGSNVAGGLTAWVGFSLSTDGTLVAIRILRSSGDAAFDAAILAAFKRVRAHGFNAEETGKSYRVNFRATEA